MNTIIKFYQDNEWLRWILFFPLIILSQTLGEFIFILLNGMIDSWIFEYVIIYVIINATTGTLFMFLTLTLAPRWHNGFARTWITLGVISTIGGIVDTYLKMDEFSYIITISIFVWTTAAYITKRKMSSRF